MGVIDTISSFISTYYPWFEIVVEKANLKIPTNEYIRETVKTSLGLFLSSLVLSAIYLLHYLPTPYSWVFRNFILFVPISLMILFFSIAGFIVYPVIRKVILGNRLDTNLVNLIAFLYSLSASGADLDTIFSMIVDSFGKDEAFPFAQYLHYRDILGWDVSKALKRTAERCPSDELANVFFMLSHSVIVSENFTPVIETLYNRLLDVRRLNFEKRVSSLTFLSEIFISTMVVLPVLVITILIIISMVGGSVFGYDPALMVSLVVYILIPFAAIYVLIASIGD